MQKNLLWFTIVAGLTIFFVTDGTAWVTRKAEAAAFFVKSVTTTQIQSAYAPAKKVHILIVPGHQPSLGGTEFGGVWERDVVVDIANSLATLLAQNPNYDVMVARSETAWNPILQNYFDTHALEIDTFEQSLAAQMQNHLADGSILPEADQIYHLTVSSAAARQLYGINKWTSDNGYDITLHLHINDDPEHRAGRAGKYDGFAVYVPDHQYSNAEASKAIGEAIAARLNAYHATSTLAKEDVGIVPDQQLIAIGSNNSASGAALLIEYGYIYEPQFQTVSVRTAAVREYAYQTYLGLQDFFKDPVSQTYGSIAFPYDWTEITGKKNEKDAGVYALQAALHYLGFYPPRGKNFSDCPVSGTLGACTRSAIMSYQRTHKLEATGLLGPKTRAALSHDLTTPQ